jgi:lamin tail-like protein
MRRSSRGGRILVLLATGLAMGGTARAAVADDLRLSEFLAGPARDWDGDGVFDSRNDEWVEVANAGASLVDLSAYRLADADSTIRYGFTGTLAPGQYLLVTGRQAVDWQRAQGRSVTGLSLNNAGDTVRLLRISGADTLQVDSKIYNSIEGGSDRSVGRQAPALDAWTLFDALNPYTGSGEPRGSGCPPSPGAANQCTTDAGRTTWGAIKNLYR